jgi:hypothetical protein
MIIARRLTSRLAGAVSVAALLTLPVLALAHGITPKTGGAYTGKAKNPSRPSYVGFSVAKDGSKYRLIQFGIQCVVTPSNLGDYYLGKGPVVSSSGAFSYRGKVGVYQDDMPKPVGSATLELSGRFTSSTQATGTAIITGAKPKLKDCPVSAFTARYSS